MSADNFNLVRRRADGRWDVWLNLSASDETTTQINARAANRTFDTKEAAVEWADAQGYTEYGTTIYFEPLSQARKTFDEVTATGQALALAYAQSMGIDPERGQVAKVVFDVIKQAVTYAFRVGYEVRGQDEGIA